MKFQACSLGALLLLSGCSTVKTVQLPAQKSSYFGTPLEAKTFYKANIHTHTSVSDGDAPPEEVISWYRNHGYDFLSITDHETFVPPVKYQKLAGKMILIPGLEITASAKMDPNAKGHTPIHVNAICGHSSIPTQHGIQKPAGTVLRERVEMAHNDGAIAMVNHPNFGWALGLTELAKAQPFELLEVASAHPAVPYEGDAAHISQEMLWDQYLSHYGAVYGTAVDDSHDYRATGEKRFPGLAWISVWTTKRTQEGFCQALRKGNFYASMGPELRKIEVKDSTMSIDVKNWKPGRNKVEFIGFGGRLLATVSTVPAKYEVQGGEVYVRARVTENDKARAWTQAYFLQEAKAAD